MTKVIFYEKPGCINNTKQKTLLTAAGHELEIHNLLTTPWTAETLRPFFGSLPVAAWFNLSAPRVKSGEINPKTMEESIALALMIEDPLLIRRPLLEVAGVRRVGFDPSAVDEWIGLRVKPSGDLENCPRSHETAPCPTKP
jgi:nitrogenase-associated protein